MLVSGCGLVQAEFVKHVCVCVCVCVCAFVFCPRLVRDWHKHIPTSCVSQIGDFGVSRDLLDDTYYTSKGGGLVPVKWTAPEVSQQLVDQICSLLPFLLEISHK